MKKINALLLMTVCVIFVSCSGDSRNLIGGNMVDSLTNTALNTSGSNDNSGSDNSQDTGTKSKKKYSGESTGDAHYVDSDVVFVSKEPFKGSGWIYVQASKVVTPPSAKTKNEGEYMIISDGSQIWTKYVWKTRIAAEKELKIGLIIIAFERTDGDINYSPENKSQALANNWFMAKITDISDKHKGYVTVSGGYKINLDNMRVSVK